MNYAVIMAGGVGTRFWPKSRKFKPKQFLNLFGEQSMICKTVNRLEGFIKRENIMVITNEDYRDLVNEQLDGLVESFVIGEPVARNTAPCVASAASLLYEEDPEAVMVVLPADHEIENPEEFIQLLQAAAETARSENSLVTIGIEPNRPETGYGYIRRGETPVLTANGRDVYKVRNFTEKPDLKKAREFLESGDYLWNSGIFIWKVETIIKEFQTHLPEIYLQMKALMESDKSREQINQFYQKCPSISIDYGIMENADNVHVVPGSFGWNDVGSWKAVHELSVKDAHKNAAGESKAIFLQASSNLVHSESGKLFSLVGVENIAVVETDDAILVVNLDNAQMVKDVVDFLDSDEQLKGYL
jgi:mannose-1-phosphate guanylyltransferase